MEMKIKKFSPTFLWDQGFKEIKPDLYRKNLHNIDARIFIDYREDKQHIYGYQGSDVMTSEKQRNLLKRIRRELEAKEDKKQTKINKEEKENENS